MTERSKEQTPFDERAALGQLERFRADIDRYRRQRQAVSEDFEEFVRSFPSPVDIFPSEQPGVRGSGGPEVRGSGDPGRREAGDTALRAPSVDRPAVTPVPADGPAPNKPLSPAPKAPVSTENVQLATSPPMQATRPVAAATHTPATEVETPRRTRTPLLAALIVLLIVGAVGVWMFRRAQLDPATSAPTVTEQAPQAAAPVNTTPAPATPPAAAPVTVESEITTVRTAWVRLIADGERVFERELPANTRVPFTAEKTVVIRTGDAGAVRLSIRGEDQGPLGRDGEVVTRSFTVPAKPPADR